MKNFFFIFLVMISIGRYESIAQDTTTICDGESLKLSMGATPEGLTLQWFRNDTLVSFDVDYIVTQPGSYTLISENAAGCSSEVSAPLVVTRSTIIAVNDSAQSEPDGIVDIAILQNDESPCHPIDTASLLLVSEPSHGTVVADVSGKFRYTAAIGYIGNDTFTYSVSDANGNISGIATVVVTVVETGPLPIFLSKFDAIKQGYEALLKWTATYTDKASHFDIERSADGRLFNKVGSVAVHEDGNTAVDYSFIDDNTLTGNNFYRLKMIDVDATFSYSTVRMLNFDLMKDISIYPNPATDIVKVAMGSTFGQIKELAIIDLQGRILIRQAVNLATETIDIHSLASAPYYLRLISTNNNIIGSFKISKTE